MMVELYRSFAEPLSEEMLFRWHRMAMSGSRNLRDVGRYRTGTEPMQVVSGSIHEPKVHFEAPSSSRVPSEMARFISWFSRTAPGREEPPPALTRAGIAHLYFESIHPFEDGNGRIGRAILDEPRPTDAYGAGGHAGGDSQIQPRRNPSLAKSMGCAVTSSGPRKLLRPTPTSRNRCFVFNSTRLRRKRAILVNASREDGGVAGV
jgi:Fic/DOC family